MLGGVLAHEGRVSLPAAIAVGVAGAMAGDSVGYWIGRRWRSVLLSSVAVLVALGLAAHLLVRRRRRGPTADSPSRASPPPVAPAGPGAGAEDPGRIGAGHLAHRSGAVPGGGRGGTQSSSGRV